MEYNNSERAFCMLSFQRGKRTQTSIYSRELFHISSKKWNKIKAEESYKQPKIILILFSSLCIQY